MFFICDVFVILETSGVCTVQRKVMSICDQLRTVLESNIATGASSIQPSDFRKQKEDVGLSGNEDNIEDNIEDLDSEAQMDSPMCTRYTTQIPSKKGKRPRPHAESQEAISHAMKDVVVTLVNFCEKDDENSSKRLKIMESIATVEQEKFQWSKKQTVGQEAYEALLVLPGLEEMDKFKAMKLFENSEMRNQFLCLPQEMKLNWLKFHLNSA